MTLAGKSFIVAVTLLAPCLTFPQSSFLVRPEYSPPSPGDPYNVSKSEPVRPRIGLVLSGGGARGITHIGTLKALEKHGIPIDFIVGNSMGAIVGGLYAAGYSTVELESIALHTNWTDVLSLTEDTRRSELYLDQKHAQEHSFLLMRLDGLEPVIPSSISSGQRLTNFLTELTLQAVYHPSPGFDDLKIPFRAVATDLISGKRVILAHGSLAEALRATVTVPLLFAPLKRDGMELVDGGLVSNAPVDVAKEAGCDIVISSNSTSKMRPPGQLNAPWETADQIMTIMMQASNEKQFGMADFVITPNLGNHLSSEFNGLDSLIRLGEEETGRYVDTIRALISSRRKDIAQHRGRYSRDHIDPRSVLAQDAAPLFEGDDLPVKLKESIIQQFARGPRTIEDVESDLQQAHATGRYADVHAEITGNLSRPTVVYHVRLNPILKEVRFRGNTLVAGDTIREIFAPLIGSPISSAEIRSALETTIRLYRRGLYSLARIDSLGFDGSRGVLHFFVNEGLISRVTVEGNDYTEDYVIRREFPQDDGELFNVRRAQQGVINVNSTGLFEYVLLDVAYEGARPVVIIKVAEKSTNNVRIGVHVDNERGPQGLADLRDVNLFGSGAELGLTFAASNRNMLTRLEYRANRIFNTILTFNLRGYYRHDNTYAYRDAPANTETRWERIAEGEYRQVRYGGTLAFGTQLERFGNITTELRMENQEIRPLGGTGFTPERYKLVSVKLGTVIDTENRFPFPTSGMMLTVSFESALQQLGSQASFAKILMAYENYTTVFHDHTFRPRITVGVADATLPLAEQFSLGGINSFFGLREDDSRGRQLFLVNAEYRFRFPFRIVFDTFLKIRYDLGMIASLPEEISLGKFHHGIGAEFAIDTPIGPASIGAGKSFFIRRDLRDNPLSVGPTLFYFSVGYGM